MSRLSPSQAAEVERLAGEFGVAAVRVFGSRAKGRAKSGSDLDLLVRFRAPVSLLKVIAFQQSVEAALGLKVDVVEEGGLSPYLKDRILAEAVSL